MMNDINDYWQNRKSGIVPPKNEEIGIPEKKYSNGSKFFVFIMLLFLFVAIYVVIFKINIENVKSIETSQVTASFVPAKSPLGEGVFFGNNIKNLIKCDNLKIKITNNNGGVDEFKSKRASEIVTYACTRGVVRENLKILIAWIITENGSMDEKTTGDGGMSSGLFQCHKKYRKCSKTYEEQLKQGVEWLLTYTTKDGVQATGDSAIRLIRKGHNSKAYWYESKIRKNMGQIIGVNFKNLL